jgi:hypothetical protein
MDKIFDIVNATRKNYLKLVNSLSIEQLNIVPHGLNNNIAWNLGHIIVSQQTLCYSRANLEPVIQTWLIPKYKPGTRPESFITQEEISLLSEQLFLLIEQLYEDVKTYRFQHYEPFTTQFGVAISSINDAIKYIASHDSLHYGYSMALRRLVVNNN